MNKRNLCMLPLYVGILVAVLALPVLAIPGQPNTYVVSVELQGQGTLTVDKAPLFPGHTAFASNETISYSDIPGSGINVIATATPAAGWYFDHWLLGRQASPSTTALNPATLALSPTGSSPSNWVLRAVFTHLVSVSADPTVGGTTSGGGSYADGAPVTVVATPNPCYTFVNWTEKVTEGVTEVSTSASYSFTAAGNRTLVAHFAQTMYTIAVSADPTAGGTATVTGGSPKACGTQVTVVATPNPCYTFVNWTEGGTEVSTSASYSFTAEGNRTLVAHFAQTMYTIGVSADPTAGGTAAVTGGSPKACGTQVTVVATPNPCYAFVNWTEGGTEVSTSASYSFTAEGNRTLVAHFAQDACTLFEDGFDGAATWTVTGLWHVTAALQCISCGQLGGKYAYFGKDASCNYSTGARVQGVVTSPSIRITSGVTSLVIRFDHYRSVESARRGRDTTSVDVNWTGATWKTVWTRSSTNASPNCVRVQITCAVPRGRTQVKLRFRFDSGDGRNNTFTGWAIDNVAVRNAACQAASTPLETALTDEQVGQPGDLSEGSIHVVNYPNPIRDVNTTTFDVQGVDAEAMKIEIYDLNGSLVFEEETPGTELVWHTVDLQGEYLANGVYLYRALVCIDGEWTATPLERLVILR